MDLRRWCLILCFGGGFCTGPLISISDAQVLPEIAGKADAASSLAGWDTEGVAKKAAELFKKDDYAGLEKLVSEIKSRGYDIRQTYPELSAFYSVFIPKSTEARNVWLDRQTKLDGWLRAMPDSLTAKIVMADWYIGYAWKARGTGKSNTVSQEGWALLAEFLGKASEILKSVPPQEVDDPHFFRLWLTIALGRDWSRPKMEKFFRSGTAMMREFYPLYSVASCFLLPKWNGEDGDCAKFAAQEAANLAGEKGEMLYALLARETAREYDDRFFARSSFDYARVKNAFETEIQRNEITRFGAQNDLCYLASIAGDKATAKGLFLDLGSTAAKQCFGGPDEFLRLRKASGVEDEFEKAIALEQNGKIDEAEALWISFHPEVKTNPWLKQFYLRQGLEAKLRQADFPGGKKYMELLDTDLACANPDALAELSRIGPMLGLWEKGEAAAQAFDQKRPWNVTGKTTLWLCALRRGDKEKAEAVRTQVAGFKTDRPAYRAVQAIIKGEKSWETAFGELNEQDAYIPQAATAAALHFFTEGQPDVARALLRKELPLCRDNYEKRLVESLLFGSISRELQASPAGSVQTP